jgi:DNA-binding NtrC family response regulator
MRDEVTMLDILVVDDEPLIRMGLAYPLSDAGHRVTEASDGAEALSLVSKQAYDIVICDIRLPKVDGLVLLRHIHRESPGTAVVLITAYGNVNDAVMALREGASDYVTKPIDPEALMSRVVARIAERHDLTRELAEARDYLSARDARRAQTVEPLIGRSPPMVRLLERIDAVAASDAPVLISGESGTGKELVARTLHHRSARGAAPFVAVSCAALPDTLLEAELFGHERGAFTGAVRKREGRFVMASGGTLLLDEVGEMSPAAQVKLLRVLEEGRIEPLGSSASIDVDARVISATNVDLRQRVAEGRFRDDLYYRLNVLDLAVPPLRDRSSDLPLLLEHFLARFAAEGGPAPAIAPRAWAAMLRYGFPGNVREFAHLIERAVVLARGGEIGLEHLPAEVSHAAEAADSCDDELLPLGVAIKDFERAHLARALRLTGGKRARAAELLGISRKNLWEKLRSHHLVELPSDAADDLDVAREEHEVTGEFQPVRPRPRGPS